ncbi:MAG: ribosome biogenesis GTP-binding protein YihA/YsxC [Bacteroidales bacterium]|nr:ribosome biogenesis GTP-binding protein YihA/YsxC [Bacteroidales bacterium]
MIVSKSDFVKSSSAVDQCPTDNRWDFAFIGRSNVGKSSLINMLCNRIALAKVSATPGKTQLINHFLINDKFYIVDLPGYGYAKVSKSVKEDFQKIIKSYILERESMACLFVLVDSRHEPQKIDLEFMQFLGENGIPFAIIFTKADKLTEKQLAESLERYRTRMLEEWEEMPQYFVTSSAHSVGRDEVLNYIDSVCKDLEDANV